MGVPATSTHQVTKTPAGGSAAVTQTQYDGEGRVTSISSPQGVISYTYDNLGRKTATIIGTVANPLRIISDTMAPILLQRK